ncbi:cell wall-binding protein [Clostridium sp. chh4-2]|uniref:cell wall-binding protein n=1 Tax=Clostridium sp. chh4-2 TaxID=2067550 RepID=UPI000CCE2575|nr:cell wall-binding protein [Clostridium sp. chh4-2]PNV59141.1 cell wall-binding protein [Clostridium sp. chh4-2]
MKKRKLAVLVLAAALCAGTMAFSAYAAEGWTQSNGNWVYYDSNGNKTTNAWKKGADDLWRYLGSNGEMVLNSWVEDTYYMDSNGIMVTNKWMKLAESGSGDSYWYYFTQNGKAAVDGWKKVDNKWYHFDDEGRMETGWVDDDMYYAGDDGVMKTGWQKLYPPDDDYDQDRVTPASEDGDGKYWFYFTNSGKKYCADNNKDYEEKKVNGVYYCFDSDGAMQTGWVNVGDDADENASIEDYRYYGTDGKVKTGWLSIEPPEPIASNYEDEVEWFYFSNQGKPKSGPKEGDASTSDFFKLNGRTYLFNDKGNPVYGLQKIELAESGNYTAYYFGDKATSSVLKGKRKVEEDDGNVSEFYFADTGKGYNGVKDGYLYYMGKLQKAESGTKYQVITIDNKNYVVNTSGKLAKSTTVKNGDGVKYKTNSTGILVKEDDEEPASSYNEPSEPVWSSHY